MLAHGDIAVHAPTLRTGYGEHRSLLCSVMGVSYLLYVDPDPGKQLAAPALSDRTACQLSWLSRLSKALAGPAKLA